MTMGNKFSTPRKILATSMVTSGEDEIGVKTWQTKIYIFKNWDLKMIFEIKIKESTYMYYLVVLQLLTNYNHIPVKLTFDWSKYVQKTTILRPKLRNVLELLCLHILKWHHTTVFGLNWAKLTFVDWEMQSKLRKMWIPHSFS